MTGFQNSGLLLIIGDEIGDVSPLVLPNLNRKGYSFLCPGFTWVFQGQ